MRKLVDHSDIAYVHTRLVISFLCVCATFWASLSAFASEVKLEEIPLSLYNKPVTGYRLTLDRSQRFVEQQIIRHVAEADAAKPFQYERTLIYENIRYAPITDQQDISLYYLMRGYENHYTELTFVAMYDYRRSISTRDFPDLSLRVQIDLARLVRKTSGDVMRMADIVFDDPTIRQLLAEGPQVKAPAIQKGLGEEEVDRNVVVVPREGFHETPEGDGGNPDSTIAALRKRVQELEAREYQLAQNEASLKAQQADLNQKQSALQAKISENKLLRDSINVLNTRVKAMLGQYYVSDDVSISNETAERMAELERENKRQQKLIARLERSNDSLIALAANSAGQAETLSKGRQGMLDEISRLRNDNERLQVEVNRLRDDLESMQGAKSGEASADSLLAQLRAANRKSASQTQEMDALRKEQARLQGENDQLLDATSRLEERIASLESENRGLQQQASAQRNAPAMSPADRDSLNQMRQRMVFLEKRAVEAEQQQKMLADRDNSLRMKEAENKTLQGKLTDAQTQLGASQAERKRLEQTISSNQTALKTAQDAAAAAKAEQDRLQKDKAQIQARLNSVEASLGKDEAQRKTLADSIIALNRNISNLDGQIRKRDAQIRSEIAHGDSLEAAIMAGYNRENELRRQSTLLQSRIDSLSRFAAPETEQQKFIRDQWSKLSEWEKQLETRENSTRDQEKLSAQRATSLDAREKDIKGREATIQNLEERERQLKLREQQLDARESIGGALVNPADVRMTKITEFGSLVPVFAVEADLNYRAAQRQVVAYMLSRDVLLSAQFPDLVFQNAYISELSEGQIEMKVRLESRGAASLLQFSFQLPDGNYLGTEQSARLNESARQFIVRMLRFKN